MASIAWIASTAFHPGQDAYDSDAWKVLERLVARAIFNIDNIASGTRNDPAMSLAAGGPRV